MNTIRSVVVEVHNKPWYDHLHRIWKLRVTSRIYNGRCSVDVMQSDNKELLESIEPDWVYDSTCIEPPWKLRKHKWQ